MKMTKKLFSLIQCLKKSDFFKNCQEKANVNSISYLEISC